MSGDEQVMALIYKLGRSKNKPPTAEVADTYVELLGNYPLELLTQAIHALIADPGAWFPTVGQIAAAMRAHLQGQHQDTGQAPILGNDQAWRRALLTVRAYQPETRPRPTSNNPAIDAAIARLGGVTAMGRIIAEDSRRQEDSKDVPVNQRPRRADPTALNVLRRDFLQAYEEEAKKPEHLRWALDTGGTRPLLLPGKEIPGEEIARIEAGAQAAMLALPAVIEEVAARDTQERGAWLGHRKAEAIYPALPAPSTPLTPERRLELKEELARGFAALSERMTLTGSAVGDAVQGAEQDISALRDQLRRNTKALQQFPPEVVAEAEAVLAEMRRAGGEGETRQGQEQEASGGRS